MLVSALFIEPEASIAVSSSDVPYIMTFWSLKLIFYALFLWSEEYVQPWDFFGVLLFFDIISVLATQKTCVTRHFKAEVSNFFLRKFGYHRNILWYPNNASK